MGAAWEEGDAVVEDSAPWEKGDLGVGQLESGNLDLKNRKVLKNPDGSYSTESSITITETGKDGREIAVNIPTVIDGRRYEDRDAIAYYKRTGQHLGKFASIKDAEDDAQSTHLEQEERYAPPSRTLGVGDAFMRGMTKTLGESGRFIGRIPAAASIPVDYIASMLGATEPGAITDAASRLLVEPSQRNVETGSLQQGEKLDIPGTLAYGTGQFVGMAPEIVAGGPARTAGKKLIERAVPLASERAFAPTAGAVARSVTPEVAMGIPSAGVRSSSRAEELAGRGASPLEAGVAGAITAATTPLGFAAPAAAPGGIVSRFLTGGGANAVMDTAQTGAENFVLPPELRGDLLGPETVASALLGGTMGAVAGGRAPRVQSPGDVIADRQAYDSSIEEALAMRREYEANRPIMMANGIGPEDPRVPAVLELLRQRAARRLAAQREAQEGQLPPSPEEQALRASQSPPGTIVVDAQGRAQPQEPGVVPGVKASMLSQAGDRARQDAQARGAFSVAGATADNREPMAGQRGRKQQAVDESGMTGQQRDLRDASAGGTTTPEGTAATAPETFTFLDVKRDKRGNVLSTGPQVEIVQDGLSIGENGKEVPAVQVRYTDETGAEFDVVVPAKRVEELSRPANPRYAQDISSQSYAPPKGTGTGEQQPSPRSAAQRITTEAGAEFLPGDRGADADAVRQGETFDGAGRRVGEPPQLEDLSGAVRDNGERTPLLPNEPRKVEGPQNAGLLPGPDSPVPGGRVMVDGEGTARAERYGDSSVQREPGAPYKRPPMQTPIVGGEQPQAGGAVVTPGRETPEAAHVAELAERVRQLEEQLSGREPSFARSAAQRVADQGTERERDRARSAFRQAIGGDETPTERPPLEVVEQRPSRERRAEEQRQAPVQKRPFQQTPLVGERPAQQAPGLEVPGRSPVGDLAARVQELEARLREAEATPGFARTADQALRASNLARERDAARGAFGRALEPRAEAPATEPRGESATRSLQVVERRPPRERSTQETAAPESERTADLTPQERKRLEHTEVTVPVREEETGRTVRMKMSAAEALADVDSRIQKALQLWECLNA